MIHYVTQKLYRYQVGHPYLLYGSFFNDWHRTHLSPVAWVLGSNLLQETHVNEVDDLEMARKEVSKEINTPLLQGFRQDSMVCVTKGSVHDLPCLRTMSLRKWYVTVQAPRCQLEHEVARWSPMPGEYRLVGWQWILGNLAKNGDPSWNVWQYLAVLHTQEGTVVWVGVPYHLGWNRSGTKLRWCIQPTLLIKSFYSFSRLQTFEVVTLIETAEIEFVGWKWTP